MPARIVNFHASIPRLDHTSLHDRLCQIINYLTKFYRVTFIFFNGRFPLLLQGETITIRSSINCNDKERLLAP